MDGSIESKVHETHAIVQRLDQKIEEIFKSQARHEEKIESNKEDIEKNLQRINDLRRKIYAGGTLVSAGIVTVQILISSGLLTW